MRVDVKKLRAALDEDRFRCKVANLDWDVADVLAVLEKFPSREQMPDERESTTHKFIIHAGDGEYRGYITVGFYPDGRPGELFIKLEVPGEPSAARATQQQLLNALLDGVGVTTAIALQNGAELRSIVDKFYGTKFDPWGPTEHPQIARCTSVLDYVFRWLGIKFVDAKQYAIVRE